VAIDDIVAFPWLVDSIVTHADATVFRRIGMGMRNREQT
jgi:hypothetical protein